MTNPFNRGSTPGRERHAFERPGTFKPGHKKVGGRKKGTPNALTADYKRGVIATAYLVGRDGRGTDGIVGYFRRLLIECPEVGLMLLGRMFLLDDGWPPDGRTLTMEQINGQVRDLIGIADKTGGGIPESALITQWPINELIPIAIKRPKDFGKSFAAIVPPPTRRVGRTWGDRSGSR